MSKLYCIYLLANSKRGALYVGVTPELAKRVWEHKQGLADGFTKRYSIKELVCYEVQGDVVAAITREKQIKKWNRIWKVELIEEFNPEWRDLYDEICI